MANGHGGHRTPNNPAPVSGPGRLSKRTDGGPGSQATQKLMVPSGMEYGDRAGLLDQERTAGMAQQSGTAPARIGSTTSQPPAAAAPQMPAFGAPTARPNEPITHGVDIGPGGGSDVLPTPPVNSAQRGDGAVASMLRNLSATDATGDLATLYQAALTRGV